MSETSYKQLLAELERLLEGIEYDISILSNASSLMNMHIPDINWVGFYLLKDNFLILGPFQGKPACTVIPLNRGVCGTAAMRKSTIVVNNVEDFPGHIACDSASKSEICIPIFRNKAFYGLLDIDSPLLCRFAEADRIYLEKAVKIIENALESVNL